MTANVSVERLADGLRILIRSPRGRFSPYLYPVALALWGWAGTPLLPAVVQVPWMIVALAAWLAVATIIAYAWAWTICGYEQVVVRHDRLSLCRVLLGWLHQERCFAADRIERMRAVGTFGPGWEYFKQVTGWGWSQGLITFEFEGKTVRFGRSLSEPVPLGTKNVSDIF